MSLGIRLQRAAKVKILVRIPVWILKDHVVFETRFYGIARGRFNKALLFFCVG